MTHLHKALLWLLVLAALTTGLSQAWMRYLLEPVDEFSAWNHAWQGTIEALHVFVAPLLTLVLGYTLAAHAKVRWQAPGTHAKRRRSGALVTGLLLVLVLTGAWMAAWTFPEGKLVAWIHGVAGSLFGLAFLGHALRKPKS